MRVCVIDSIGLSIAFVCVCLISYLRLFHSNFMPDISAINSERTIHHTRSYIPASFVCDPVFMVVLCNDTRPSIGRSALPCSATSASLATSAATPPAAACWLQPNPTTVPCACLAEQHLSHSHGNHMLRAPSRVAAGGHATEEY